MNSEPVHVWPLAWRWCSYHGAAGLWGSPGQQGQECRCGKGLLGGGHSGGRRPDTSHQTPPGNTRTRQVGLRPHPPWGPSGSVGPLRSQTAALGAAPPPPSCDSTQHGEHPEDSGPVELGQSHGMGAAREGRPGGPAATSRSRPTCMGTPRSLGRSVGRPGPPPLRTRHMGWG